MIIFQRFFFFGFLTFILCNFFVRTQQYLKKIIKFVLFCFARDNMKKTLSKVAHNQPNFFFSTANRPKKSPNLNFCSMKIAHRATYAMYNDFARNTSRKL